MPAVGVAALPEASSPSPGNHSTDPAIDMNRAPTFRPHPSVAPFKTDVQYDEEGIYGIPSFFRKLTYLVRITVGITSQAMMTVTRLLDSGSGPNLVSKSFLLHKSQKYVRPVKQPQLRTTNCEPVNLEGTVRMFVHIGNLHARVSFEVVENLAVDLLLGPSFIDRCIQMHLRSGTQESPLEFTPCIHSNVMSKS